MRNEKPLLRVLLGLAAVVVCIAFHALSAQGNVHHTEQFRVTALEVLEGSDSKVNQIRIECVPGSKARVTSDKEGGGGVSATSGRHPDQSRASAIVVTMLADHVKWEARNVDALKFVLAIQGSGGNAVMSNTGSMEAGKQLSDVVKSSVKSGEYKYGTPIPILRFKDRMFSLTVTGPDSD